MLEAAANKKLPNPARSMLEAAADRELPNPAKSMLDAAANRELPDPARSMLEAAANRELPDLPHRRPVEENLVSRPPVANRHATNAPFVQDQCRAGPGHSSSGRKQWKATLASGVDSSALLPTSRLILQIAQPRRVVFRPKMVAGNSRVGRSRPPSSQCFSSSCSSRK